MSRPRVVFFGTPDFAVPALRAVAAATDVVAVVTQPDRPRGRGQALSASEVAAVAGELGLTVLKPAEPGAETTREALAERAPDLCAVVAFGAILPRALLELPRLGCINLHGSMLPDYRGASPVQRALWDGRAATGVTTLWMDEGIDTGDLILQRWEPIRPEDDAGTLARRLAELGAPLLVESLRLAHLGTEPRQPQDRAAGSYARKLAKADGQVDWALEVDVVWNRQRAVTPWPGATTTLGDQSLIVLASRPEHRLPAGSPGTMLGVEGDALRVACAPGVLRLERVRPQGRAAMSGADWARGVRLMGGERLGVGGAA